jgi:hypothetical protein
MNIKVPLVYVIGTILALLSVCFIAGRVSTTKERKETAHAVIQAQNQLLDAAKTYEAYIGGQKETIAEQRAVIMHKDVALEAGILEQERLRALQIKEVRENVKLRAEISVLKDSLLIVPNDTVIYDTVLIHDDTYLKLPSTFSYKDQWLTLNTNIHEDLTWGFDLRMPLSMDVTLGEVKTGFMKREPSVVLQTPNPYIGDIRIQNVQIETTTPWYRSTWMKVLTHVGAFGAGYYLGGR